MSSTTKSTMCGLGAPAVGVTGGSGDGPTGRADGDGEGPGLGGSSHLASARASVQLGSSLRRFSCTHARQASFAPAASQPGQTASSRFWQPNPCSWPRAGTRAASRSTAAEGQASRRWDGMANGSSEAPRKPLGKQPAAGFAAFKNFLKLRAHAPTQLGAPTVRLTRGPPAGCPIAARAIERSSARAPARLAVAPARAPPATLPRTAPRGWVILIAGDV